MQFLRSHSSGVAVHSLHMPAMAIDIRMWTSKRHGCAMPPLPYIAAG
jgi:hypothetical protein